MSLASYFNENNLQIGFLFVPRHMKLVVKFSFICVKSFLQFYSKDLELDPNLVFECEPE